MRLQLETRKNTETRNLQKLKICKNADVITTRTYRYTTTRNLQKLNICRGADVITTRN